MKIRTSNQYFAWVAVDEDSYGGPGDPIGRGATEIEAIRDLLDELEDRAEARLARNDLENRREDAKAREPLTNHGRRQP